MNNYAMDGTKKLASDVEKDIIPTAQPDNKKEEIKEALTHEYYGTFDDGNHPGQYDIYEAKDLEEQTKMHKLETTKQEKKPDEEVVLGENDFLVEESIEPEIFARLEANQEKLPWNIILEKLKNNQTISCELQRRTKEKRVGWTETVGAAGWFEFIGLGEIFTMQKEKLEGNIVLYITFQPTNTKPLTLHVSSKLVEYPNQAKGDMINKGIVFSKTLNGKEFEQEKKI